MIRNLILIFIVGVSFQLLAQADPGNMTTINYNDTIPHYYLDFENDNVKFNWGTISKSNNLSETMFFIRNSSEKDIVVLNTNFRNNHISFHGEKNRTIKPGGFYEVKCTIYLNTYPRRLHERILINYVIDKDTTEYLVQTYGDYKPQRSTDPFIRPYPMEDKTAQYSRSKKGEYVYDITNKRNEFNWGEVGLEDSTELVSLRVKNTTYDTLYIRSIDMAYEKVYVRGEINGRVIQNRTNVNVQVLPGQSIIIYSQILSIKEPIYHFAYPNFLEIVYVRNSFRQKFRLKNIANGHGGEMPGKIITVPKPKPLPVIKIEKGNGKEYHQNYTSNKQCYYFNFSDANQSIDWGVVTVSPTLDSVVFLVKNTTGKEIIVTRTELQNNFTNWSLSKDIKVKPNAYFEVKPHFYSIHYTSKTLNYPLTIDYKIDKKLYKLVINTSVSGIYKPKTTRDAEVLKTYEKNRKIQVNNTTKHLRKGIKNYTFDFKNTNYGFDWGEFDALKENGVTFTIVNNSKDTLYLSQINNPIKNFDTYGKVGDSVLRNRDYNNIKVLPYGAFLISLNAKPTKNYGFQFPFHVRVKYFQNGERKVMRIINNGTIVKLKPIVITKVERPRVVQTPNPVLVQAFSLHLDLPSDTEPIDDLVFIRWNGTKAETHYLKNNAVVFNVKDKEIIYGMFYCEKYGVISKFSHKVNFKDKKESTSKNITAYALYENRDDYYYGSRNIAYIKQPYKIKDKGYYMLNWITQTNDNRKQSNANIKSYLRSLGYSGSQFLYEPNLAKAISLEKTLKNSKYAIGMEQVIWHNPMNEFGWGGGYEVYSNYFEIEFTSDVSEIWIKTLFKKYQITTYSKARSHYYTFQFKYIVRRSYMRILDKLWMKREVKFIRQNKTGAPNLD